MGTHKEKGQYGYRDRRRRVQLAKVLFGAAMILVQAGARGFTDSEAARNILTVMAVLSVLPTANVAAPLLASWKYRTPPADFYERVKAPAGRGLSLDELSVTSTEQIIPIEAVMVHQQGVFVLCTVEKTHGKKAEKYLNDTFKAQGLDPNVKVIQDETMFLKRLDSLKPVPESEDDGSAGYAARLLKSLSM